MIRLSNADSLVPLFSDMFPQDTCSGKLGYGFWEMLITSLSVHYESQGYTCIFPSDVCFLTLCIPASYSQAQLGFPLPSVCITEIAIIIVIGSQIFRETIMYCWQAERGTGQIWVGLQVHVCKQALHLPTSLIGSLTYLNRACGAQLLISSIARLCDQLI